MPGDLGKARCTLQLDVGYGDAVTPGPEEAAYPTLLDDRPPPRLRVYPRATVVAEKLEAIVSFGMANSRMKDYFDLRALASEGAVDRRPGQQDAILAAAGPPRQAVPDLGEADPRHGAVQFGYVAAFDPVQLASAVGRGVGAPAADAG